MEEWLQHSTERVDTSTPPPSTRFRSSSTSTSLQHSLPLHNLAIFHFCSFAAWLLGCFLGIGEIPNRDRKRKRQNSPQEAIFLSLCSFAELETKDPSGTFCRSPLMTIVLPHFLPFPCWICSFVPPCFSSRLSLACPWPFSSAVAGGRGCGCGEGETAECGGGAAEGGGQCDQKWRFIAKLAILRPCWRQNFALATGDFLAIFSNFGGDFWRF